MSASIEPRSPSVPVAVPSARYSARFVRAFTAAFWPFARVWFRPRVEGLEQVPSGPCIVVGNHSGYAVMEIFLLLTAWTRQRGTRTPVAGLAHDLGLSWILRWGVARIGGIRAKPESALEALRKGLPVLVFPGGDVDAFRPFSARYEVHWGGRSGFVELARAAGVPVVPFAICGSHAQYTVLPGARTVAKVLGLRRLRLSSWGIPLGALAPAVALTAVLGFGVSPWWLLAGFAAALFPNPTRIDLRFLEPVSPEALRSDPDPKVVAERIRARIEAEVRAMSANRRTPWF
jgi:1-acyl-sn-glycerol-3-phosphate acyltransferase